MIHIDDIFHLDQAKSEFFVQIRRVLCHPSQTKDGSYDQLKIRQVHD